MKRLAAAILLVLLAAAAAPTRVAAAPHEPLPPSGDSNLSSAQLLGAGRALLMILAHPLVAAAVHDHSTFTKGNDSQRMQRFERTDSMVAGLMFGDSAQVERAANAIRAVHSRVHGTLHAPAAGLPAGTPYAASDPDLLRWVLASFVDSMIVAHERISGRISSEQKDRFTRAISKRVGKPVGVRGKDLFENHDALQRYIKHMFESKTVQVTDTARSLATPIIDPPLPKPLGKLARATTLGLLQKELLAGFGVKRTRGDKARFGVIRWIGGPLLGRVSLYTRKLQAGPFERAVIKTLRRVRPRRRRQR